MQATLSGNGSGHGSTAAATAGNGVSLAELADRDKTVFVAETLLPTRHGDFRVRAYRHSVSRPAASKSALRAPSLLLGCVSRCFRNIEPCCGLLTSTSR